MIPKAHLTSHPRMSGSWWVTTPPWWSGSLRAFLYSSSVYSYHLFLISSASVSYLPFFSFIVPLSAWNVRLVSPVFLKRSLVFLIGLFSSISLRCSLKKAFWSLLAILWNSAFIGNIFPFLLCLSLLFFSQLFVRPAQTTTLPSCISFSWGWFWSPPPVKCYKPVCRLHALCLPDLVPWIYSLPPLYNHEGFDLGHIWMV